MKCLTYNTKMGLESSKYLRKMSLHEGLAGNHEARANRSRGGCETLSGSLAYPRALEYRLTHTAIGSEAVQ